MVDGYPGWSLAEIKKLTYRERQHWLDRYLYKLEQELQRRHRQNNSPQVRVGSIGQGVTFR
ncbi:hypothetical protein HWB05_gp135 [Streptomyces phage BRock]|uniref:Uncharacterized protein n=1 Tax=Streptomyces phage BRock TaxID=1913591 RepID=A0A1J0GW42_9CAUD|nr:hypothetical protein HWB05_gp135 [Streptomyces phage BRock]APC46397.1 hypothetical protein [Streptomyces phage BRock]